MAQYQIGSSVYEIPDNTPPGQLDEILRELAQQNQPQQTAQPTGPDTSFGSAFMQGIDQPLENIGTTLQATGLAPELGQTLKDATQAPTNYESAAGRFINPQAGDRVINIPGLGEYGIEYLPRAAVEQAGQYAGSLISRGAGAAAGGLVAGLPGAVAGGLAGPALFEFTQQLGPVALERAKNDGRSEPNWDDWTYAAATAGVSGALNALGVSGGKGAGFLNKTLREGVTEGTQSAVEQTGTTIDTDKGLTVSAKQAVGEGIIGGTTAGAVDATTRLFTGSESDPTDNEAAADLATRLQGIADANKLNMRDIKKTSTKGAREAVDKAHVQIASEMNQLRDDLKKLLKVDRLDPIDVVVDKVSAEAAHREARNKTKNTVGKQEMDATERLVGNTREGQQLLKLYRQMNELTELHNAGYIGGLSQYTDLVSPFSSNVGYTARSAAELPTRLLATGLAGATLSPAVPAAQLATVGAGRFADALTGRRSIVRKYMRENAGKQGVPIDPSLVSVREQAIAEDEQRKREEDRLREIMLERGNPPKGDPNDPDPSPEYVMQSTTGLNREGIEEAFSIIEKEVPELRSAIKAYRKMLRKGTKVPNLTFLIQEVKGTANKNPQRFPNRKAPQPGTIGANERPGYLRGIEANRQAVANIKQDVVTDKTLSKDDKQLAFDALDQMNGNLGVNPAETVNIIRDAAVQEAANKDAVAKHLDKYVSRVENQQKQAAKKRDNEQPDDIEGFVDLRVPEQEPPRRKHREIGEELMVQQAERYGRDLDPYNDGADFETVVDTMTEEARFQFDKTPDAAHWYDNDIRKALATTAELIPQINESADNRQLFLLLAALTSVGHKPRINWRYAGALGLHYFNTGELGEIGQVYSEKRGVNEERLVNPATGKLFGLKAASIEPGLKILRHMLNTYGITETLNWVNSDKTKAEIDAMRKEAGFGPQGKIKGGMKAVVPAIQMFGPKVGPFYMNLNGLSEVTVDLWASRTVRRHTGGLLDPLYDPDNKKNATDSGLVDAPTEVERPTMKDLFTRVGENLGVTPQAAQAILWAYEQELYNDLGAKLIYEKFSEGAEQFRENEAVAYAERHPGFASGQNRSRKSIRSEEIEPNKQLSLNFDGERSELNSGLQSKTVAAGSRPATPEEIREVKPTTDAMFEVGKPGSPYENGIPDIETAKKLAEALGLAMTVADNKNDLARVFGLTKMGGGSSFVMGGLQANPDPSKRRRDRQTGKEVKGIIGVLGPYTNPRDPSEKVTPLDSLYAALHEIGHGIEGQFVPGTPEPRMAKKNRYYSRFSDGSQERSEKLYDDTFRQAIASLMDAAAGNDKVKGYSKQDAKDILDEIVRMQRGGVLSGLGETTPVRHSYNTVNEAISEAEAEGDLMRARDVELQLMKFEDTYLQTPQELAADLIGTYLINPKYAKMAMPKATKLVRDVLNNGNAVKFYSMPLSAMVAAIFANMLVAEGEEEERKGILAQQTI